MGGVKFSGKKRYEGVRFNVISVTSGWVGSNFQEKGSHCIANTGRYFGLNGAIGADDRADVNEGRENTSLMFIGAVLRKRGKSYICWAQSVDLRNPWIALRNLWIHTLRRNPWIAQESVDRAGRSMNFAYDTIQLAQTYMDGLVISTNLKCIKFTHFNG